MFTNWIRLLLQEEAPTPEAPAEVAPDAATETPVSITETNWEGLMNETWAYVRDDGVNFGIKVLVAIAIFFIGKWLARVLTSGVKKMLTKARVEDTLVEFLGNITNIALMVLVIIAVLGELGIQTASFAAVLAAAGLAVGLALQGSLSNFASGVMLILFRPIKVGDVVEIAGKVGKVDTVEIFSTVLITPDDIRLIIPNSQITSDVITNFATTPNRRVDLVIGISYNDNIGDAKRVLEEILQEESRVLPDPSYSIVVGNLGDSSVDIFVRPWVRNEDYWDVRFALIEKIKVTFDEKGISFPFPSREIYMHTTDSAA
jgi:small conductance mechanosensitive channel